MQLINGLLAQVLYTGSSLPDGTPEPSIISFDAELIKNMLFIGANVILLVVVLALVLYKPVRRYMDERKKGISDDIEGAKTARKEAEELKLECEQRLRDIEKEREQVFVSAQKKAMERSDSIIKEAREEAEAIHKHTIAELEEERAVMQAEVKRQLIELSVLLAERFVTVSIDEKTQEKYVDEAIDNWEEKLWLD